MSDPLTIEALALRDAVVFAREKNYSRAAFEADCSELVASGAHVREIDR
jgi:hypothetical protein